MRKPRGTADDFLTISPRVRVLPIIHGSGDFAIRVREELLSRPYDCLAVPLPPSFQDDVEECIERLPTISVVAQLDVDRDDAELGFSYVPIDPCQGVIAALRTAIGERIVREFIDMETPRFEAISGIFPDPYALKRVTPERFAAALLPAIPPPQPASTARESPGWPAPARAGSPSPPDLAGLLAAGLALDSRRLLATRGNARARAVLRATVDLHRRSQNLALRAR